MSVIEASMNGENNLMPMDEWCIVEAEASIVELNVLMIIEEIRGLAVNSLRIQPLQVNAERIYSRSFAGFPVSKEAQEHEKEKKAAAAAVVEEDRGLTVNSLRIPRLKVLDERIYSNSIAGFPTSREIQEEIPENPVVEATENEEAVDKEKKDIKDQTKRASVGDYAAVVIVAILTMCIHGILWMLMWQKM